MNKTSKIILGFFLVGFIIGIGIIFWEIRNRDAQEFNSLINPILWVLIFSIIPLPSFFRLYMI